MKPKEPKNNERPVVHKYAEVWLNEAVELLRPRFRNAGYEIPPVHVSVGFSTDGYRPSAKRNTVGICYARRMTRDGVNDIYISPLFYEPVDVISLLVHELIHAIDDCKHGHGPEFQKIAQDLKSTDAKKINMRDWRETIEVYRGMARVLGRYPRSGITYATTFDVKTDT